MTTERPMTFTRAFNALSLGAIGVIALYVGSQIEKLTQTIQRLSEQIAIVTTDAKRDREDVRDLKERVRTLENARR